MASAEISEAVGMAPRINWSVGENKNTPSGGTREETYCTFRLLEESTFVDNAISSVLSELDTRKDYLEHIVDTGGKSELFIGIFVFSNTGFELDQTLLEKARELKTDLLFDLYEGD